MAVASMYVAMFRRRPVTPIYMLLVLPGTLLHELAHLLVGFCMNAKPRTISIVPRRSEQGWTLGSVGFVNMRWYNGPFAALAPLLLIPVAVWIYLALVSPSSIRSAQHWAFLYIAAVTLASAMPSSTDARLAWRTGKFMLAIILAIAAFGNFTNTAIRENVQPILVEIKELHLPIEFSLSSLLSK